MPPASRRLSSAQQRMMALLADGWYIVGVPGGYVLVRGMDVVKASTWTVEALIRRRRIVLTKPALWTEAV